MIRLAEINTDDLPAHSAFDTSNNNNRPNLLLFALTILEQGRNLVLPTQFNLRFKHHSQKSAPPSNTEVEVLSCQVLADELTKASWGSNEVLRPKPAKLADEHWYARRSFHHNLNSKRNAPGTASWEEFVYGLRDNHSKNEQNFTPTIYDAHYILDWNEELQSQLSSSPEAKREGVQHFTNATMALYEMCHAMPGVVQPRCFPVLVLTADVSESEFIAVTLPVNMSNFPGSFYSSKRNKREGADSQQKKSVTLGNYVAVERVHKYVKQSTHTHKDPETGETSEHKHKPSAHHIHSHDGGPEEEIEWVMATASDARGGIPIVFQRMGIPGAIVKDVGLFLKWIHKVPDEEIKKHHNGSQARLQSSGPQQVV